jgi:hypothetical protein
MVTKLDFLLVEEMDKASLVLLFDFLSDFLLASELEFQSE